MFNILVASHAIVYCVFNFVYDLVNLDSELGSKDSHVNLLVDSLHNVFTRDNGTNWYYNLPLSLFLGKILTVGCNFFACLVIAESILFWISHFV